MGIFESQKMKEIKVRNEELEASNTKLTKQVNNFTKQVNKLTKQVSELTKEKDNLDSIKNTADLEEWTKLADFLGIDKDKNSSERSEATYFACLKILSESIGKLPLKLLRKTKKHGVIEAVEHSLYGKVRYRPNKFMTSTNFWSTIEQLRNHYGNAYALIDKAGSQLQLIPLDSSQVQIYYDDGKLLSEVPDIWYVCNIGGKQYCFSSEEILHFKTSNTFDGIKGLSVRETLRATIQGNQKAQNMQNALYDTGFVAKAVVQYTGNLNDENVKKFLQNIEKYAKGEVKAGKGFVPIPLGSQLTPLSTKLGDNEFLELKKYSALQIAASFGIKPVQINDYSKSSYASSEAQNLAFLIDTLLYILKQYEEELNYKLLTEKEIKQGYYFKFNIGMLLRADMKTQIESLRGAVNDGIYTRNEAREMLDKEALPGGDELTVNGSTVNLKDVGIQYKKNGSNDLPEEEQDSSTNDESLDIDEENSEGGEIDEK